MRRLFTCLAVAATALLTTACGSAGYLSQSVQGHLALMRSARPVPEVIADPATPAPLRDKLELSQRMRDYAVSELALPDNASYRRYAALDRPAVVWNVVAAPELSLKLRTWCFPVVGCVGYRGYFDRARAEAYAAELKDSDATLEVAVYGVPAYSSLGKLPGDFFADPLLSTFIGWPEGELARLIFHELSHQVAYASGDTEFNESYATAVERLGGARWLAERASAEARDEYTRFDAMRRDFRALTWRTRERLQAVYEGTASADHKRAAKARVYAQLREEYAALKAGAWNGDARYDGWIANANNARLGVQGAYDDLVPAFVALFEREGRDFARFHREVKRLAGLPAEERRATLNALMPAHSAASH